MQKYLLAYLCVYLFIGKCFANEVNITLVTEHLPPYQIVHSDSTVTGFSTEIVEEVFNRAHTNYTLYGYPWVRTYNLALKKNNHCIYSIARIPSRENLFSWIGGITEKNNAVIWALKSNKNAHKIENLDDLKKYTTAVNKNDVTHTGMLDIGLVEKENLYVVHYSKSLINLLVTRPEIDFIVVDDITISHRAKWANVPMDSLQRVIEVKSLPLDFYLACNKKTDQKIIDKLKRSLASVHEDGTYEKILVKWSKDLSHIQKL